MNEEYIVVPACLNEGKSSEVFFDTEKLLAEFETLLVNSAEDSEFVSGWNEGICACMKALIGMRDKVLRKI